MGKIPPGQTKKIQSVDVVGNHRIIRYEDGSIRRVSKAQLMGTFQAVLSAQQKEAMGKTMKLHKNGSVSVKLGGMVKGKRKIYKSIQGAKKALARRYPKINSDPHAKGNYGYRQVHTSKRGSHGVPKLLGGGLNSGGPQGNARPNPALVARIVPGLQNPAGGVVK